MWLVGFMGFGTVSLVVSMERERERMRAWWKEEQGTRQQLVSGYTAAAAELAKAKAEAETCRRWAQHLLDERHEIESLAQQIHEQLTRGEEATDHGLKANLRCVLDHVTSVPESR